jgi:8-oxo-dGTP diphosphatase
MAAGKLNQAKSKARSAAYTAFGHLPPRIRRGLVGVVAPSFTVGALAVVHDGDRVLFVTQLHRPGLSLPGGLLKKGEEPRSALARELSEELGLDSSGFAATPDTAHVDAGKKRVDLIFFLDADRSTLTPKVGSEVLSFEWRAVDDPALTPQTKEIVAAIAARIPR